MHTSVGHYELFSVFDRALILWLFQIGKIHVFRLLCEMLSISPRFVKTFQYHLSTLYVDIRNTSNIIIVKYSKNLCVSKIRLWKYVWQLFYCHGNRVVENTGVLTVLVQILTQTPAIRALMHWWTLPHLLTVEQISDL